MKVTRKVFNALEDGFQDFKNEPVAIFLLLGVVPLLIVMLVSA